MTTPTAQERRRARTRQEIIDNAYDLLVRYGVDGVSIRALADRIDYTPGALYKYFASKEALIDAVRQQCFDWLNAYLADRLAGARSASDMLIEGGLAYIEYAGEHPHAYHLMFNMEPSASTSGDQRAVAARTLEQVIEMGIASGEFVVRGDYDRTAMAYHCWATVHGIASLSTTVLRDERAALAVASRVILTEVVNGLSG